MLFLSIKPEDLNCLKSFVSRFKIQSLSVSEGKCLGITNFCSNGETGIQPQLWWRSKAKCEAVMIMNISKQSWQGAVMILHKVKGIVNLIAVCCSLKVILQLTRKHDCPVLSPLTVKWTYNFTEMSCDSNYLNI